MTLASISSDSTIRLSSSICVNDDPTVMGSLMKKLLTIRVRPYYLFWTPLEKGLKIVAALREYMSGLCVPHFAIVCREEGEKSPCSPNTWLTGKRGPWSCGTMKAKYSITPSRLMISPHFSGAIYCGGG